MALTPSTPIQLGTAAPDFSLADTAGRTVSRADFDGRPLLVMFICNHCPYVKHVADELRRTGEDYGERAGIIAINSNDADAYPEDSPAKMAEERRERGYPFPYLYDASQAVARAYGAACTPDLFLFDAKHRLFYHGQLDDTRPRRIRSGVYDAADGAANGHDLRAALDAVLAGGPPPADQRPSVGCNIKWRPGAEPT